MDKWIEVKSQKTIKSQKKLKWKLLLESCPHIITPSKAKYLQTTLNVDNLVQSFDSDEWIKLQQDGYVYIKIVKSGRHLPVPEDDINYKYLIIDNKWKDKALFKLIEL